MISIDKLTYNRNTYSFDFAFQKLYTTFLISIKLLTEIFELIKDEPLFDSRGTHPKAQEYINKIHPDDLTLLNNFIQQSFKDSYKTLIDLVRTKERNNADFILKSTMFMGVYSLEPIFTFLNKYKKNFKSLFINFNDTVSWWSLSFDSYGFNSVKSFDIFMDLFESIFAASEQPKGSNTHTNNANNNTNSSNTNSNNTNNTNNKNDDIHESFFLKDLTYINGQLDKPSNELFNKIKSEFEFIIEGLSLLDNGDIFTPKAQKFLNYLEISKFKLVGTFHALNTRVNIPADGSSTKLSSLFYDVFKTFPFQKIKSLNFTKYERNKKIENPANELNNLLMNSKTLNEKDFNATVTSVFQQIMKKADEEKRLRK